MLELAKDVQEGLRVEAEHQARLFPPKQDKP